MEMQLEVRLIDGNYTKKSNALAHCHAQIHRGYLTKSLIKTHDCFRKNCSFFEKLKPEYWAAREAAERGQENRKQKLKAAAIAREERDSFIRETLGAGGCVHVTSIHEKKENILTITYIYDLKPNLSNEIALLQKKYKMKIILCANAGTVETIEKLIKAPRRENRIVTDLCKAPKVGNATKKRLAALGVYCLEDLFGRNAKALYAMDCKKSGQTVNRRYLTAYASAITFAHTMGISKQCPISR